MNPNLFSIEEFKGKNKKIVFFGSNHAKEQIQISFLRNKINEFNPDLVLVEGNFNNASFNSEEEAVEKGAEMGFVAYLSKRKNIFIDSNDPSQSNELIFIKENHNQDTAFLYFFLRNRNFLRNLNITSKKIIDNQIIQQIEDLLNINDVYSINKIKKIFYNLFKKDFSPSEDYVNFFNPTLNINEFNKITRELNEFRDNFMLKKVKDSLKSYNKILIVKGKHHLDENKEKIWEIIKDGG